MPASWEISNSNQIVIGILHVDATTMAWSLGFRNLMMPGREEFRMFNPFFPVAGMPFDQARNTVIQHALSIPTVRWVGMLDSDVIPPRDAFLRLISHNLPFCSGVYCRRSPPHAIPVMQRQGQWLTELPPQGLIEVDVVGAGCCVLRRDMLEKLPPITPVKKWYSWEVDARLAGQPCEYGMSEDFSLNLHMKKHGYKVMVDSSIRCRHVGLGEADYGSFVPCYTNPIT